MENQKMPEYETIRAAVAGEKWAVEKVVECYKDEIDRLGLCFVCSLCGVGNKPAPLFCLSWAENPKEKRGLCGASLGIPLYDIFLAGGGILEPCQSFFPIGAVLCSTGGRFESFYERKR